MHDALWHLDHQKPPVLEDYRLGTELNKFVTDLTGILADQVLNRADVAAVIAASNMRNKVLDTAAGLVIGSNDLTIKIANAFHYSIAGAVYLKGATDNIALPGSGYTCALSKYAAYLITINATGAIGLVKGADATSAALAMAALASAAIADDLAPVGIIHIQNDGTEFIPGATAAGKGDFDDDTTASTYVDFVGVGMECVGAVPVTRTDIVAYSQTFTEIT